VLLARYRNYFIEQEQGMVIFVFVYTVLEERSLGSAGRVTQNLSVGVLYTPNGLTKMNTSYVIISA
jgi:hypothetical protein